VESAGKMLENEGGGGEQQCRQFPWHTLWRFSAKVMATAAPATNCF